MTTFDPRSFGADVWTRTVLSDSTAASWGSRSGNTDLLREGFIDTLDKARADDDWTDLARKITTAWPTGHAFPNSNEWLAEVIQLVGKRWQADAVPPFVYQDSLSWEQWRMLWSFARDPRSTASFNPEVDNAIDRTQAWLRDNHGLQVHKALIALLFMERARILALPRRLPVVGDKIVWHSARRFWTEPSILSQHTEDDVFEVQIVDPSDGTIRVTKPGTEYDLSTWISYDDTVSPENKRDYYAPYRLVDQWSFLDEQVTLTDEPAEPTEVERLRAELEKVKADWAHDLQHINEVLGDEAENRDWCTEYEAVLTRRINPGLRGQQFAVREVTETHKVSGYLVVPFGFVLDVTHERGIEEDDLCDAIRQGFWATANAQGFDPFTHPNMTLGTGRVTYMANPSDDEDSDLSIDY